LIDRSQNPSLNSRFRLIRSGSPSDIERASSVFPIGIFCGGYFISDVPDAREWKGLLELEATDQGKGIFDIQNSFWRAKVMSIEFQFDGDSVSWIESDESHEFRWTSDRVSIRWRFKSGFKEFLVFIDANRFVESKFLYRLRGSELFFSIDARR
jgi:hypothetical protein